MEPILTSTRLILKPWETKDHQEFHSINTDSYVRKYLWDDEIISEETTTEILDSNHQYFDQDKWGLWKIIHGSNGETMGYAGLWYFFDENQPELLYAILPQHAGKGYATEAAKTVIDYAFGRLGYQYLIASIDTPHEQSRRMCERLGMKHVENKIIEGKPTSFFRLDKVNGQ